MPVIHRLPLAMANLIAAGEVVERPAAIAKELIENALDAGAGRVTIEASDGGRTLRVTDDGCGMDAQDAALAFERFATSKLQDADDLWRLTTNGFRGEALASLAAVAKVELLTRRAQDPLGTRVRIEGGTDHEIRPAGAPPGTSLGVSDLFFNTPARLKFLRAPATELGHLEDAVIALALAHPQVGFTLLLNGKQAFSTVGSKTRLDACEAIFGTAFAEALLPVRFETEAGHVEGLTSRPDATRADRSKQWLFLNGRWIKDPLLARAVLEAYAGHMPSDRQPQYVLDIAVDPALVDVNVHPQKREVRLGQPQRLFSLVREALIDAWTRHAPPAPAPQAAPTAPEPAPMAPKPPAPPAADWRHWDFGLPPKGAPFSGPAAEAPGEYRAGGEAPRKGPAAAESEAAMRLYAPLPQVEPAERERVGGPLDRLRILGQLNLKYILCEHPDGLYVIDQHNGHERWLYEQLTPAKAVSQTLLLPLTLTLGAKERALAAELAPRLAELGFEVEPLGPDGLIVRSLPALLPREEAEATLRELLTGAEATGVVVKQPDDDPLRRTIACHSAVRAGTPLSFEQMTEILQRLRETKHPLTCPHGRPTAFLISERELDKRCLRA